MHPQAGRQTGQTQSHTSTNTNTLTHKYSLDSDSLTLCNPPIHSPFESWGNRTIVSLIWKLDTLQRERLRGHVTANINSVLFNRISSKLYLYVPSPRSQKKSQVFVFGLSIWLRQKIKNASIYLKFMKAAWNGATQKHWGKLNIWVIYDPSASLFLSAGEGRGRMRQRTAIKVKY